MDRLQESLKLKKDLQAHHASKEKSRIEELVLVNASLANVEQLQKSLDKKKLEFCTRVTNMIQWKQHVELLKKQIEDPEARINAADALKIVGYGNAEEALNVESIVGVAHFERVNALDVELAELDSSLSLANACLKEAVD